VRTRPIFDAKSIPIEYWPEITAALNKLQKPQAKRSRLHKGKGRTDPSLIEPVEDGATDLAALELQWGRHLFSKPLFY